MAKPRKQHQQASKKKLQVKQSQKQTKAETVTEEAKDVDSSGSTAKLSRAFKAAHQPVPAEAAGSEQTVYGLNNLGNTCFYNSALQVQQCIFISSCGCTIVPSSTTCLCAHEKAT